MSENTTPTDEKNGEFQQESPQPSLEASAAEAGDVENYQGDVEKETDIPSSAGVEDNSDEPFVADQNTQSSLEVGVTTDLDQQDSQKSLVSGSDHSAESQNDGETSVKGGEEFLPGVSASGTNVADTKSKSKGTSQDVPAPESASIAEIVPDSQKSLVSGSDHSAESQNDSETSVKGGEEFLPGVSDSSTNVADTKSKSKGTSQDVPAPESASIADISTVAEFRVIGIAPFERLDSQDSNSSSGGEYLKTVVGCRSSVESGAAGDISSSLGSQEGPSPPSSNIGDSRKGPSPPSSNIGDSLEGSVPGSANTAGSEKEVIPHSSSTSYSKKGAVPRTSSTGYSKEGAIPLAPSTGYSEKGAIPRASNTGYSEKGAIVRSSTIRDSDKGAIARSSTIRDSDKGAIARSSTIRDSDKGAIPRSSTIRDSDKGAIARSSNTAVSQNGAVSSSSKAKDSQEMSSVDELSNTLEESGAVGDISSSTTPPCIFISGLPPIPPGRLPWDYDSGDTPPRESEISSGCFPVRPAAGNTRRYDQCFSRCCCLCDYIRPCCRLIRKSKIFKFIRIALLFLTVVYMSFGVYYMDSCPVQSKLNVLMFVSGIISLALLISSLLIDERRYICPNVWKEFLTLGMVIGRIIFLAVFAAVLNATYSISPSFEHGSEIYCDEIFYSFTYYSNFVVCGIVILAFLLYVPGINDNDYERL